MKRKISLFICVLLVAVCFMAVGVCAETYYPNDNGEYTVELSMEPNNEYVLFAIKGEYDQTNYIEAFNAAKDEDVIYFEQKLSDANGNVVFDSFVPMGYYNATLVLGGTNLDEPCLVGHLSVGTASNTGSIKISGVNQNYTVTGINGEDVVIDVETEVFDSFGFPSLTGETVELSLSGNDEDVVLDGNVITIGKTANEQLFFLNASAGTASAQVKVYVSREEAIHSYIEVYSDADCTNAVSELELSGVAGAVAPVTLYAKTFDQYNEEIEDTYTYVFDGNTSTSTVTPPVGTTVFTVKSASSLVEKTINIVVNERPDYKDSAFELYELIASCEDELSKLGTEKFVSSESGNDIAKDCIWIYPAGVTNFEKAIDTARAALDNYGTEGYGDADYSDEVTALTKALNTYTAAFKAGLRSDVTEVSINEQNLKLAIGTKKKLTVTTVPVINSTTDKITWTSSDSTVASVNASGEVTALKSGKATIIATTRGGLESTTEIEVYKKAAKLQVTSKVTAVYGGEAVVITASVFPYDCTDEIVWNVANPELAELVVAEPVVVGTDHLEIKATVVPKSEGKCNVTVTAVGGAKSATCALTVTMPDWETAATPEANVESGSILAGTGVSLSTATEGATIYYTLDGTVPSKDNGRVYKNPIVLNQTLTLKAVAVANEMFNSEVAVYEYKVVGTKVMASSVTAKSGDTVDVYVTVDDFSAVKNANITVAFESSIVNSVDFEVDSDNYDVTVTPGNNDGEYDIAYTNSKIAMDSDTLVKFVLKIADEAEEGDYAVEITEALFYSDVGTGDASVPYDAIVINGNVNVNNYIIGDADDNGKIGLSDVLIIKQYLAGDEEAAANIVLGAADVDADGDVDDEDVLILSRYCVGWKVTLGKSN